MRNLYNQKYFCHQNVRIRALQYKTHTGIMIQWKDKRYITIEHEFQLIGFFQKTRHGHNGVTHKYRYNSRGFSPVGLPYNMHPKTQVRSFCVWWSGSTDVFWQCFHLTKLAVLSLCLESEETVGLHRPSFYYQ